MSSALRRERQHDHAHQEIASLREIINELKRARADFDLRHWVLLSFSDALIASSGWRMLAPLRWIKNLVRPRGFSRDDLHCWKDLEPLAEPGGFRAIGNDPQLVVCCYLPAGWLRVRLRVKVEHKTRLELYAERDGGFQPTSLLGQFTLTPGENNEEFFLHLDRPTRAIRIDPLDGPGEIRIHQFEITPRPRPYTILDALRRKLRLLRAYNNTLPVLRKGAQLFFTGRWREVARKWSLGLHDPRCVRHGFYEPDKAYQKWIKRHELTDADRAEHRQWAEQKSEVRGQRSGVRGQKSEVRIGSELATGDRRPATISLSTFSIILPTFRTPPKYLRLAIESVLKQTYPHWELCIADDGSPAVANGVQQLLEEYARQDSRFKIAPPAPRGGIGAASNRALALATGDFVTFLDHDDELAEQALYKFARAIDDHPDTDMLYSDEDKLSYDGRRMTPFFKPDWSPEFLLGCMYTCHLSAYRTDLVREVGAFRTEYDGAQDYDLALRISQKARRVVHVPDVLYHWRLLPNSTASSVAAKPEAHAAAMRALDDHLRRTNQPGRVEVGPSAGLSYTRFEVRGNPLVSIIIPSQCREDAAPGRTQCLLENCISSIARHSTWKNYEIIVLDRDAMSTEMQRRLLGEPGASATGEFERLGPSRESLNSAIAHAPGSPNRIRRVTYHDEFNWSRVNNLGARHAQGEYLVFLNDDMEIKSPDWIESLLEFAQQPQIGIVGAKLQFPDGSLQHVGVAVLDGKPGHPFYGHPRDHAGYHSNSLLPRNVSAVTGACLMTHANVFHEAKGFDETLYLNYNDIDFCFRVRELGYRVVYTPHAQLIHFEGVSKPGVLPGELQSFQNRWGEHASDPYYNPNLNMETFDFRIG